MSTLVVSPNSANTGGYWFASMGVDGTRYLNSAAGDETWLQFGFSISLPSNATIIGAQVNLYADASGSAIPYGEVLSIDAALTLDVTGVTGPQIRNEIMGSDFAAFPAALTFGGPNDTWGQSLTPAFFNSSNFVLAVRRGTQSNEYTSASRAVQAAMLTIYYVLPGGSMASRNTATQKVFIGKEGTPGTLATTWTRLTGLDVQPQPKVTVKTYRGAGSKLPLGTGLMNEACELPVSGSPGFNELGFLFSSIVASDTEGLISGSSSAYRHTFASNSRAADVVSNYSITYGDAVRCHSVAYGQFTDFQLNTTGQDVTISGSGMGRPLVDSATLPVGANEVQTITFAGPPTGGTFNLRFMGQDTGAIAWSATAATLASNIQTALNALPSIGTGGVVVSGTGPYTVTFSGTAVAGLKLQLIELSPNGNNLTGTSPTITFALTTPGGWTELPFFPIEPDMLNVYMSTSYATLTSSKMTNLFVSNVHFQNKAKAFFTLNRSNAGGLAGFAEDASFAVTAKITAQADTQAMALLTSLRTNQPVFIRLEYVSTSLIDGTNPFRLVFDLAMAVENFEPFQDEEGVYATSFTLTTTFDSAVGYSQVVTLDSGVASY